MNYSVKNRYPTDTKTAIGKADEHSTEIETFTQEQREAIKKIDKIWKRATSADSNHPYIKKKRIHPMGARQIGDSLIYMKHLTLEKHTSSIALAVANAIIL
jgi:phage/plasmid primase-like uncharacterized protein